MEARKTGPITLGIAASYANLLVSLGCSLALVPVYLRHLGPEEYGLWTVASGLVVYLTLLNVGLTQSTANLFATAAAQGDPDRARRALATGFWACTNIVALSLLLVAVAGPFAPWHLIFRGSSDLQREAPRVVLFSAAAFLVELPFSMFGTCLRSVGAIHEQQVVAIGQNLVRLTLAVVHLEFGGRLPGLILLLGLANLASDLVLLALLRRRSPGLSLARSARDRGLGGELRSSSAYFFLLQVAGAISFSSAPIVISGVLGTAAVTPYAVAQRLTQVTTTLTGTLAANFGPTLLSSYAQSRSERLAADLLHSLALCAGLGALASIALLADGPAVITWWVGEDNFVGLAPFRVIVGLVAVHAVLYPLDTLLMVTGRVRLYAVAAVWEALLSVVLSLTLVHTWGVAGVVAGCLIARFLGAGPVLLWESGRLLQGELRRILARVLVSVALATILAFLVLPCLPASRPDPARILSRSLLLVIGFSSLYGLLVRGMVFGARPRRGLADPGGASGAQGAGPR